MEDILRHSYDEHWIGIKITTMFMKNYSASSILSEQSVYTFNTLKIMKTGSMIIT